MTVTGIVTSASDIAAILDTVAPDAGIPLADTPIWNELQPRWRKMHRQFGEWEAEVRAVDEPDQPVQVVEEAPAPAPRPRKSSRRGPKSGSTGSSTRRAANAPQAPTEDVSVGSQPEAQPEEEVVKLDIMTACGPIQTTGVDEEAVDAFLEAYEDGDSAVLRVPDGSATKTTLVDREAIRSVTADVDDEPEPPAEGDAEGVPAPEESETA